MNDVEIFPLALRFAVKDAVMSMRPIPSLDRMQACLERSIIDATMRRFRGNVSRVATCLEINRVTLRKRLIRHGLHKDNYI